MSQKTKLPDQMKWCPDSPDGKHDWESYFNWVKGYRVIRCMYCRQRYRKGM
jgi:hypothetical protein